MYKSAKDQCIKQSVKQRGDAGFSKIYALLVFILVVSVIGGYIFGVKQYQNYQAKQVEEKRLNQEAVKAQQEQEKQTQDLIAAQQKELEKSKQEIDAIKKTIAVENKKGSVGSANSITSIITEWRPKIAHVVCEWDYSDGSKTVAAGSGTAMIEENVYVVTNKHVLTDEQGYPASSCIISLPGHAQEYFSKSSSILLARNSVDMGTIGIVNPDEYIKSIAVVGNKYNSKWCQEKSQLGEGIVILGYPGIGSQNDITATEGIISGYDGDYYITSAKIEHGNSGGIALSVTKDCYIGIPSYAITGSVESLSRILDAKASF